MYEGFASFYDELMDNIPYDEWADRITELLKSLEVRDGLVCELGCGTGELTARLEKKGYDMIGIDNSYEMLGVAKEKQESEGGNVLYLLQDMREFELYGTVNAVVCCCDSVNYILEPDELETVFGLVNNYLETDGIFLFDFHTRYYYEEVLAESTIAEARDDISFIWDNYFDEETGVNELALTLFSQTEGGLYERTDELHLQRAYVLDEIKELLERAGMKFIAAYDDYTGEAPREDSERIVVVAREYTPEGAKKELSDRLKNKG